MKTGCQSINAPIEFASSVPGFGERKNPHVMPYTNDAIKDVNFCEEICVSLGAANKAAAMQNKCYNKRSLYYMRIYTDICPSSGFGVPLNDCVNDISSPRYPRGRVGVNKDEICQRTLTEEQHRAIVPPRTCANKLTSSHVDLMLINICSFLSHRCGQVLINRILYSSIRIVSYFLVRLR